MAPLPVPAAYKSGQQGLLDLAINEAAASGLEVHLQALDVQAFGQTVELIAAKLQARGLTVKRIDQPVDPNSYPELQSRSDARHPADRDYSSLANSGIQRLLLIRLAQVGTSRTYIAFVPTNSPQGYARATGQMVDLRTGELLWSAASTRIQPVQHAPGQSWDYPNLDRAIADAVRIVGKDLANDLAF